MSLSLKSMGQTVLMTLGLAGSGLAVNAQATEFGAASRQRARNELEFPKHHEKAARGHYTDFVTYLPETITPETTPTSTLILVADGTLPTGQGQASEASQSLLGLKNTLYSPAPLVPDLQRAFPRAQAAHIVGDDVREIAANIGQALAQANAATNNGITQIVFIDRHKGDPAHLGSVLGSSGQPIRIDLLYKALAKGTAGALPDDATINIVTPRDDATTIDAALAAVPNAKVAVLPGRDLNAPQPSKITPTADDIFNSYVLRSQNAKAHLAFLGTNGRRQDITQTTALAQINANRANLGKNFNILASNLRWVASPKELVPAATRTEATARTQPAQAADNPQADQLPSQDAGLSLLWSLQLTREPAADIGVQFGANTADLSAPAAEKTAKPAASVKRPGLSSRAGADYGSP